VNDVTAAPARYSERVLDISMAMYACSPPRVLPCSPGRSRIKDAELFDDHAGAGLLHPTAGHRIRFGPNSNVNSYRLVSGTGANFRGCAREASVNSKKFATVALTSALALHQQSPKSTAERTLPPEPLFPRPPQASGEAARARSRVRVYIYQDPKKSASPSEQPIGPKPSHAGKRH